MPRHDDLENRNTPTLVSTLKIPFSDLKEGDALLGEMEFTGQAFDEMQDQNVRLMQQIREKDDANLKLMSEVWNNLNIF